MAFLKIYSIANNLIFCSLFKIRYKHNCGRKIAEQSIEYATEELDNHRKGNYLVMVLLPMIYLNMINQPVKEYANFVGNLLALTWERLKEKPQAELGKLIAMDYAASGADEIKYKQNDNGFTIKLKNWPNPGYMQAMMTTKKVVGDFHNVWEPIAKILGLTFELQTTEIEDLLIFKKWQKSH
ncbi:MAG: hypothetical protein KGD59_04195 [Candidatus Heimdallarchaeota archaeon]|nr:hypothetical protein [Candidatus Heimdallarchaeota archaeon]MBY8993727.1 hypothetical protein [Candidatus Heimdallarchaeota archaeon]